jgi:hypothetical protein
MAGGQFHLENILPDGSSPFFLETLDGRTNGDFRHLMTGIGAYLYIIWGIWLRHILNHRQDEYGLVWKRFWHAPEISRVKRPYTNGASKKLT